ncbi:MAG: peptidoglycan DD-metalloendopeptidase family protein [Burkholderiaceae bacterium]|nr:peptidoglycan DD-metalloendopeptidase family protein [Burkholderiaceae bacterium]
MINGLTTASKALLEQLSRGLQQHPRRITAALAALLLTGGGGAFAVASLAPDAADLPVRLIEQNVESLASQATLAELTDWPVFSLFRSDQLRSTDTAESLLRRMGVADPEAAAFLRRDPQVQQNLMGRTGRTVSIETTDNHRLVRLTARWVPDDSGQFKRLVIEKSGKEFSTRVETAPMKVATRLAGGVIQSSLFAATDSANIPDAVAVQMAELFSGDVDFRRSLRKGDRFSVVYETLEADGEPLRSGRVLSAEFVNDGKAHQAVWFQEPGRNGAYFSLEGQSLRRAYLSSPLEFTRVSSGFGNRFHPIHQRTMAHLGTDYAAPSGTAVRTIGDGTVEFAGTQNGYGNVVFIKHRNQYVTVYAHLSRIDVRKGQSISQGQTLGAVGATGWATGPHLHFELRVNGQHQDPMTIAKQSEAAAPVAAAARPAFQRVAASMRLQLASSALIEQASAE